MFNVAACLSGQHAAHSDSDPTPESESEKKKRKTRKVLNADSKWVPKIEDDSD